MKKYALLWAKPCLALIIASFSSSQLNALTINDVWINEINYDEPGSDSGEFIELAGLAGTNLSNLKLIRYNGSGGGTYSTVISLAGTLLNTHLGYGFYSELLPSNGLQNEKEGIALVFNSTVLQFISYEGSFSATNGDANGMTSTDIGVSEANSTPTGQSLQFLGLGNTGAWTGPIDNTRGSVNTGQILPKIPTRLAPDSGATLGLLGIALFGLIALSRRMRIAN